MTGLLLGIDIGTTGLRAALFDVRGTLVADASLPSKPNTPHPGWAEADADGWWRTVQRLLADLASKARLKDVLSVCVTGQAPTAVLVDDAGTPTRPAILWLDTRATAEADELGTQAYYLGPKLLWLARHDPGALAGARHIVQSHAYIAYRLTGKLATDPSTAALCLPLFDLAARQWVHHACSRVGIRAEQLPPIRRAHEVLGAVTAEAANATGLRAGTPVAVGGGDFAAATLGAGVLDEGEACLMLGTAGNLLVPCRAPGKDPRLINAHHVGSDTWLSLGGTLSGGAQEWLRHALADASHVGTGALADFDALDADAARVPTGSEGLLFLPYLQGERTPIWNASARGAYLGLGLHHGRGHLWRALLEGIALSFVDCQAVLEEGGVRLRSVVAANGGGKSALFRQILCDALGVPLAYTPRGGGTASGAAILAALAAGVLGSAADARAWSGEPIRHDPAAAATIRYRELLAIRRGAYSGLQSTFAALANA
jgi:xylulokinase